MASKTSGCGEEQDSTSSKPFEHPSGPIHSTLSPDKREIRLLTICSGDFNDEIQCKLNTVSLEARPIYAALSYCWSDQNGHGQIWVNGQKVTVNMSLKIALKYWRSLQEDLVVWADGICINQDDLDEKSSQVHIMGSIYSEALHVRAWIGANAEDSDIAMDFIDRIDTIDFEDPDAVGDSNTWKAIKCLFRRKWWTRVWVVQKVLLARKARLYCGRKGVDLERFTQFKEVEWRYRSDSRTHLKVMRGSLSNPLGLLLGDWDRQREALAEGGIRLTQMILATRESQCSKPVDKIFALLSVCAELDRRIVPINYRMSIQQLMLLVAKYLLIQREPHAPLLVLQGNQTGKRHSMPSWVPDYTTPDEEGHLVAVNFTAGANNTAWAALGLALLSPDGSLNSVDLKFEDEGSFETLVIPGLLVDDISDAFESPWVNFYEGNDLDEETQSKLSRREAIVSACADWEAFVRQLDPQRNPYAKTCGRSEAFWRTLIADHGLDIQKGPQIAEWDFAGRFEAWMGRRKDRLGDEAYIRPYSDAAVTRCMFRSCLVTDKGYIGLGPRATRPSDVLCILRGGQVPFVLRLRNDGCYDLMGEAYVHGIMDGSFVREANQNELREFRIR